jgi:sulfur carrier protein
MKSLQINGQMRQFPPEEMPATLLALLEKLGIEAATVVAEVDGRIVGSQEFPSTGLSDGQTIELVKFMGGG